VTNLKPEPGGPRPVDTLVRRARVVCVALLTLVLPARAEESPLRLRVATFNVEDVRTEHLATNADRRLQAIFSERTKGSGANLALSPPTRYDVVTMPGRQDAMLHPDAMMAQCMTFDGSPSSFHFNSTGRWLPGSDWSNGWPFGFYSSTLYNHVAPPNWNHWDCGSWSAIPDAPGEHAIISARSGHSSGVNVAMGDGSVTFVTDTIELGIWRALGTRNGGEVNGEF